MSSGAPDPAPAESHVRRAGATLPRASSPFAAASIALGALAVVAALAFFTERRIDLVVAEQITKVLRAPHDAAVEGLVLWLEVAERAATSASRDSRAQAEIAACLQAGAACDSGAVAAVLAPYLQAAGFTRVRLADAAFEVRAALPENAASAPVSAATRARVAALPAGGARVLPPFLDGDRATLLVAAAVHAPAGARRGTLLFELAVDQMGRVLRAARAGESGETYAFDRRGLLVSESRFVPQLRRAGLLPGSADSAALRVALRDPGGDTTRGFRSPSPRNSLPLTRMAASAVRGESGLDVDGYRDYRGVVVVGAWRWLARYELGVATEIDRAEAFRTVGELDRLFLMLVGALSVCVLSLLASAWVVARLRRRTQRAERIAERYGQYRIGRKLGEGGMGVVYLGSHALLRRPAAIKLLRVDRATPEALSLFEREVQITATLTHPNTVAIYDYGRSDDGTLYYAMEYLEGLDLERLVRRFGPLPPARVVHFLRQLCGSLAEAHGKGLVHRDVKPANLLACTRGGVADTLKVLDFGVVLVARGERVAPSDKMLIGTPEYMAPELFESPEQAGPQADLYAVGVVAYFLLTGAPPFEGNSAAALRRAHLTERPEPPSLRMREALDPALEQLVLSCLAKHRDARPASADRLLALLERTSLAFAWTRADAEAWWAARTADIAELRASTPIAADTAAPTRRRIRPLAGA